MAVRTRVRIDGPDIQDVNGVRPLAGVQSIAGVRVYDVGQGDAIAVMNSTGRPVLQFDYGGRQGHPFQGVSAADVDKAMPVPADRLIMLSHWDEDHWSSVPRGRQAQDANWLVPRQLTSPRAVKLSASIDKIRCIPEAYVGRGLRFLTGLGDAIWWEKIAYSPTDPAREEDCNRTGVALSIVKNSDQGHRVILLPGDAPFERVSHYRDLYERGYELEAVMAFHHGAGTHWTATTEDFLVDWVARSGGADVIFSCSNPNAYHHPDYARYKALLPTAHFQSTSQARAAGKTFIDIIFT